jgi:hypothetical protein
MHMMENIRESLQAIVSPRDGGRTDLVSALQNLDAIVSTQSVDIPPKLRHFLQNRSYQKALLWIDGDEPEKGTCHK